MSEKTNQNIFQNMGLMFFVLLFGVILLVVFLMVFVMTKVSKKIASFRLVKILYETLKRMLFWNSSLRYFIESYFSLSQYSLILASSGFDWSNHLNRLQALFAIITLIFCGFSPLVLTLFFSSKIKYFRE
jgi:hypothetical protein